MKLSIYIPEKLRTRFKIACAAEQTSMNQALIGFIEEWTDEHDPIKKMQSEPPQPEKTPKTKRRGKSSDDE